jgi:hypothetical protein
MMILYFALILNGNNQIIHNLNDVIPLLVIIMLLIIGFPFFLRLLWNITIPQIFEIKKISYWESFRLFIITFLLFGIWGIIQ